MDVTEVRISPAKGGKVRAFASVVFDDCFIVNDLRVIEGRDGQVFVTMPGRKTRNGQMRDIAHPLNKETREAIEERVIAEYVNAVRDLAVPSHESDKKERGSRKPSVLDRLSAKLFSEDFWTVDIDRRNLDAE